MKIGELFISLGFDIKGQADFDAAEQGLKTAAVSGTKLTLVINAINAALLVMMDAAAKAGTVLQNFTTTTGLSAQQLQLWQHAGATFGITADEMTAAIKRLQDAQTSFALGDPQSVGVWALLGVNPTQDPFKVLTSLRARLAGVQPGIARGLLGRVGLENLAPMLQAPKGEFEQWSRNFLVSDAQVARLAKLNAGWESLKRSMLAVRNIAASALAPAFTMLARGLEWLADKLAIVSDWLNSGSFTAMLLRRGIVLASIALLALGVVIAVVTAALGALSIAMTAVAVVAWGSGLAPALLALTAALGIVVAGIAFLILAFDDLWVAAKGGKAAFDWLPITVDAMKLFQSGLDAALYTLKGIANVVGFIKDEFAGLLKGGQGGFEKIFSSLPDWLIGVHSTPSAIDNMTERMAHGDMQRIISSMRTDNHVQIHVNGADSPEATGRAVGRSVRQELDAAAYQAPPPNY